MSTATTPAERLADAADDVATLRERLTDLDLGWLSWQQDWPELTCSDQPDAAVERAALELAAAEQVLATRREQQQATDDAVIEAVAFAALYYGFGDRPGSVKYAAELSEARKRLLELCGGAA